VSTPILYSARYQIDIGLHVFPTHKYRLVSEQLAGPFIDPQPASWEDLARVHTREYLGRLRDGTLTAEDVAQLELPWSAEMVEGFRVMVGGTVQAALLACGSGRPEGLHYDSRSADLQVRPSIAVHIGGGLHHAFPNHGEGFCPFNDVAVAVRALQAHGLERAAIVDLDVHHGNGTAFIFESDPHVFTFSMHQQHNYPMWKPRGSLDIGLPDGTRDEPYLAELARGLPRVMASEPQCVFYLAGADPYEEDQLGGLRLTREGLRRRDRMVVETVRSAGVPLVITLAGGYARRLEDTVAIHVATIEEAINAAAKSRNHETT
jgi:acetoin utilization deacetylase AcuC-like enzyme